MEYESTELNRNIKIKCEPIYDEDSLEIIKIEDEIFMQSIKIEKEEIQECYHNYLPEDNRQIMKIAGVEVLVEGHLLNLNLKPTLEIQRINLNLLEGVVKTEPNHKPKKRKIYQKLKKFQCEFCKKIMSRPSLVMHFQRHHGFPARFSCHICKYAFHNPIAVENHQARYQGDCVANFHPVVLRIEHPHQFNGISFICGNCKNSFGSQISLLSHQLACNENQRYIKKELVAIKQEPLEDSKDFQKTLIANSRKQKNVHKVRELFQCPDCPYKNRRHSHMNRHYLAIHLKEKRFQCNDCDKYFSTNDHLKSHLKIWHTDEGLICDCCGDSFRSKRLLSYHITRTLGSHKRSLKFLYCLVCNKTFKSASFLKNHMQLHEEIKKEVCQHCELKFKNVEHLRRHLVAKHFPEKIQCDFCPSQLSAKRHYKKHLIKIHKETDKEVLKKVDKILVDYEKMKFIV